VAYETRKLRPFDDFDRVQRIFAQKLRVQSPPIPEGFQPPLGGTGLELIGVTSGSIAAPGGTLILDRDQYMNAAIGLYFGTHDDDWRQICREFQEDLKQVFGFLRNPPVNLLIVAYNSRLRQRAVLYNQPYTSWLYSDSWRFSLVESGNGNRPRPLNMPGDGCRLSIQFILSEDLPETERLADRPWRKGAWLSHHEIRIAAARGSGLAPTPLTDELRDKFGLGSKTTLYVALTSGSSGLSRVSDLSEVLTVYIDAQLLNAASEETKVGKSMRPRGEHLLTRWVLDVYRALIFAYSTDETLAEFDLSDTECRHSFLFSLLQKVAEAGLVPEEEALLMIRDHPQRLVALVEHLLAIRDSDASLLGLEVS